VAGPVLPFFLILLVLASSVVLAQQGRDTLVIDSILGVGIGTTLDDAHEKLDRLRTRKARGARDASEDEREEQEQEREGGRKEAWALKATDYITIALKVDRGGRVVWITGFVRPGKEIPFANLGNLTSANAVTDSRAIWNVTTPSGGYRVIAKGQKGKAYVISLISLTTSAVQ
jgi:hypothetical protein